MYFHTYCRRYNQINFKKDSPQQLSTKENIHRDNYFPFLSTLACEFNFIKDQLNYQCSGGVSNFNVCYFVKYMTRGLDEGEHFIYVYLNYKIDKMLTL